MTELPDTVQELTIVWRDESLEPLKATVESANAEGSFLYVELPADMLRPGTKHKFLYFPADTIASVEVEERVPTRHQESSTFRESAVKSPHFKAMGPA